jgi:hypothetical protein
MKMMHIFEILRVLGVLEVEQQANLQGSKALKVLKELFSKQTQRAPGIYCMLEGSEGRRENARKGS